MAVMSPQLSVSTHQHDLKPETAAPVPASAGTGSAASEGAMAMDLDLHGPIKQDDNHSPPFILSSPKNDHVSNSIRTPFVNGNAPDSKINAPPSPPIPTPPLHHSDNSHELSDFHITSPAGLPGALIMSFEDEAKVDIKENSGEPMEQDPSSENAEGGERPGETNNVGSTQSDASKKSDSSTSKSSSASTSMTTDKTMADAPTLKTARSRDDDDGEGPPLKRARTEEEMDIISPTISACYNSTAPLTPSQAKFLLGVVRRLRRTKDARPFSMPVDAVKLNIPTYHQIVTRPMDLRTMERKLNSNEYTSSREFLEDFNLILSNCIAFNGREHPVTDLSRSMKASFENHMKEFPTADAPEPEKPKPSKKKGASGPSKIVPPRALKPPPPEPKATQTKRETKRPVPAPAITAPSPTFGLQPSGIPQIRRDSTTNDRPKREIHPPAPKDLPYSDVKPRRKKAASELKFCDTVLKELYKKQYHEIAFPFYQPVDPVALNIPDYFKIIKKPMDLSTIQAKLKTNQYDGAHDFESDIRLMFANCYKFNPSDQHVHKCGKSLELIFNQKWAEKASYTRENPGSRSPTSPSPPAEDDDEEMSEDGGEDQEQNIRMLEQQLEKMKDQISQMKKGQKKKTPPVPSNTKKTKGGHQRKGSIAASALTQPPPSKSKKKGKKEKDIPYITMEQKTELSERINFLPSGKMAYALKMIKENMPDLGNGGDEEIELDIDELDPQTLFKLHTYVSKHAPPIKKSYVPPPPPPAPVGDSKPKPKAAPRPKKNKPMSAVEQEAKIKDLQARLQNFDNPTPQPSTSAAHGVDSDSSDDVESSGSESEED